MNGSSESVNERGANGYSCGSCGRCGRLEIASICSDVDFRSSWKDSNVAEKVPVREPLQEPILSQPIIRSLNEMEVYIRIGGWK